MELTAYKMADLQKFRSLLQGLRRDGIETLDQALTLLTGMVSDQHAYITQAVKNQHITTSVEICPSCGKGLVTRWPRISDQAGVQIYGCKRCQWSGVRG